MLEAPVPLASLTSAHGVLDEVFWLHREALLYRELELAQRLLDAHGRLLAVHMAHEDDLLLPELERHSTRKRWPAILYSGQHEKMLRFLERIGGSLGELSGLSEVPARGLLELLDVEATFLHLVEHHNQAEESALYPELDAELPLELKAELVERCSREWQEALESVRPLVRDVRNQLSVRRTHSSA